jgi:hypothetical protein
MTLVAGLVVIEGLRFPGLRDPDGGWPAVKAAAERILRTTGDQALLVIGLPRFKPADGLLFPLRLLGGAVIDGTGATGGAADTPTIGGATPAVTAGPGALVIVCDRLFEPTLDAACGGAAERTVEGEQPAFGRLVDRFDQSGRISISIYAP